MDVSATDRADPSRACPPPGLKSAASGSRGVATLESLEWHPSRGPSLPLSTVDRRGIVTPTGRIRPAGTRRPAAQPAPDRAGATARWVHRRTERPSDLGRPPPPSRPPTRHGYQDRAAVPRPGQPTTTSTATGAEQSGPRRAPSRPRHAHDPPAGLIDQPVRPCPAGTTHKAAKLGIDRRPELRHDVSHRAGRGCRNVVNRRMLRQPDLPMRMRPGGRPAVGRASRMARIGHQLEYLPVRKSEVLPEVTTSAGLLGADQFDASATQSLRGRVNIVHE
jgi:hypothetical protein